MLESDLRIRLGNYGNIDLCTGDRRVDGASNEDETMLDASSLLIRFLCRPLPDVHLGHWPCDESTVVGSSSTRIS